MYYIYKHENNLNHKTYIGCSTNPIKRWRNGRGYETNKTFFNDIIKYGWDNFSHIILLETESLELASAMETELIRLYNAEYNTTPNSTNGIRHFNTKHSKAVLQLSPDGTVVAEYPSAAEAERKTGIHFANISYCCYGKRKFAGGFRWAFKENKNNET